MNTSDMLPFVWPLCFVLVTLFILRQLGDGLRPVFTSITTGLSRNASTNATKYAIAIGFGLSASLSAFYDVFNALTIAAQSELSFHQYAALWTKVLNPFIVAVLAYATQSNTTSRKSDGTNPPIPT